MLGSSPECSDGPCGIRSQHGANSWHHGYNRIDSVLGQTDEAQGRQTHQNSRQDIAYRHTHSGLDSRCAQEISLP